MNFDDGILQQWRDDNCAALGPQNHLVVKPAAPSARLQLAWRRVSARAPLRLKVDLEAWFLPYGRGEGGISFIPAAAQIGTLLPKPKLSIR
jgi:hypothetical protein